MKKIGILSDTHGYLPEAIFKHFGDCDEIWHAGDIGTVDVLRKLEDFKPVKAVYGNIDGQDIRKRCAENLRFICEGADIWITHIGGYPGRYQPKIRELIKDNPPDIFICGHSHILKVIPDRKLNLLHINPGAAGKYGIHKVITFVKIEIERGSVKDLKVIELPGRSI